MSAASRCGRAALAFAAAAVLTAPVFAQKAEGFDPLVERGRYIARAGDCISCHTGPSKVPFAGGLPMKTPFGTIVSTNITPDTNAGIGGYTEADFARALREGKSQGGHNLYPAMPYTAYTRINDEDMHALYTYFRKGVAPSAVKPPRTDLPWPFSMRSLVTVWNWIYLDKGVYQADAGRSAEWNRGAYLVQGLGHCGECHTPRGLIGGVKADSDRHGDSYLAGALIDGWLAQPLRHGNRPSAAQWPTEVTVAYLQTGRSEHTATFGPMSEVVENSTQYLSREDLSAIAVYLQSLGTTSNGSLDSTPKQAAVVAAAEAQPATAALRSSAAQGEGAMVYLNNCNACHRSSGAGASRVFPALAGNSVVNARDPTSLIRMVLEGSSMPSTEQAPSALTMPAFAWRLTDANVASLLSFMRSSWGNQAEAVTAAQVATVRKTLKPASGLP